MSELDHQTSGLDEEAEHKIKQLQRIVCICKGIKLKSVLPALKECDTVEEMNNKTGCGTGGCSGQRCGPRIRKLLEMKKAMNSGE